jgi:hypothetical protein
MSIDKNYYAIAGFDLTPYKTDKFDDWKWEDENEKYFCYQRKGNIQLFDDPMSGSHLYLGYILGDGDEYELKPIKFNIIEVEKHYSEVNEILDCLTCSGVIDLGYHNVPFGVIVFEECT